MHKFSSNPEEVQDPRLWQRSRCQPRKVDAVQVPRPRIARACLDSRNCSLKSSYRGPLAERFAVLLAVPGAVLTRGVNLRTRVTARSGPPARTGRQLGTACHGSKLARPSPDRERSRAANARRSGRDLTVETWGPVFALVIAAACARAKLLAETRLEAEVSLVFLYCHTWPGSRGVRSALWTKQQMEDA